MINNTLIEIALGCIQDVATVEKYDVDRIELFSANELGGLTPSLSTVKEARRISSKNLACMCRCRGGNFCYTEAEYKTMFEDAKLMLENGADGIVFGFLNADDSVNVEKSKEMIELIHSYNKEAVFHKASDVSDDLDKTVKTLAQLGIDRILTSGKAVYPDILAGCPKINELHKQYPNITFLPGGGVRVNNIADVLRISEAGQVHMTSKKKYDGDYVALDEEQLQQMLQEIKNM